MLVGSAPSELKLGSTTVTGVRRGAGLIYDSDVAAFQKASGATQVGPLLALVDYLKAQSLWDYARFYPMKSAQNAGSGSTVYGLGGLTSNNMTLVNSPTWGSDGVAFNGSTQYGNVGDANNGNGVAVFARVAFSSATPAAVEAICGLYITGTSDRSIVARRNGNESGDPFEFVMSSTGLASGVDAKRTTDHVATSLEECLVYNFLADGSMEFFQNKIQRALSRFVGEQQPSGPYNSAQDVFFAASNEGAGATLNADLSASCCLWISGTSFTATQRETITDLINAL